MSNVRAQRHRIDLINYVRVYGASEFVVEPAIPPKKELQVSQRTTRSGECRLNVTYLSCPRIHCLGDTPCLATKARLSAAAPL